MKYKALPNGHTTEWHGYTLDELRYERVVTLTRIEIEKSKIIDLAEKTRSELPLIGTSTASTLIQSINKLDYIIFIVKLWRKLAPLFKKKK